MINYKMTIGKKLWILSAIGMLIVIGVAAVNKRFSAQLVERIKNATTVQLPLKEHSLNVSIAHDKIRAAVFRGIFASQIQIEEELTAAKEELDSGQKMIRINLESLTKFQLSDEAKKAVEKTDVDVTAYLQTANEIFNLLKQNKTTFALELQAEFQTKFENVNLDLVALKAYLDKSVASSLEQTDSIIAKVDQIANITSLCGVLFSLIISFLVIRDLMKTLRRLITRLTEQEHSVQKYTAELEVISKNLSQTTSDQASAVTEAAASLDEITSMVDRSADHSKYLAENSHKSIVATDKGVVAVNSMLDAMNEIGRSSEAMVGQFEESNKRILHIIGVINQISERTKVINDIVFQTKLLSFNASVEAARAGEHGKGFAVVAQEIGILASKSGESSKEINSMLELGIKQVTDIIEKNRAEFQDLILKNSGHVSSGKKVAEVCGESLDVLAKQVEDVAKLTNEISSALAEQKMGVAEINKTIAVFSSSASDCARSSGLSSEISNQLQAQVHMLNGHVEELETMVNGQSSLSRNTPPGFEEEIQESKVPHVDNSDHDKNSAVA